MPLWDVFNKLIQYISEEIIKFENKSLWLFDFLFLKSLWFWKKFNIKGRKILFFVKIYFNL